MIALHLEDVNDRYIEVRISGGWAKVCMDVVRPGERLATVMMSRSDARLLASVLLQAAGDMGEESK